MTREEAISWLKHCATTKCENCVNEVFPEEYCDDMHLKCVETLEREEPIIIETHMLITHEEWERIRHDLLKQNKNIILLPVGTHLAKEKE